MRKDLLAAGQRSAKFAGGVGENDVFRNVMSAEDAAAADAEIAEIAFEKQAAPRKKFIPTDEVMLVRRTEAVTSFLTEGIVEKEKPAEGIVLERGNNVPFAIGDHLVFGKYSGTEFKLNGEILILLKVDEVQGTLVDETQHQYEVGLARERAIPWVAGKFVASA
jgi:chaperonin GroES